MTVPQYAPQRPPLSIQRDRLPITTVIARGVSPVAIRSLSVPYGDGRGFAPLRIRIATSGFALLAMTW